jgi:hypothetical protein
MQVDVREAVTADLDTIASITREHRHQLAVWSPQWWRTAEGADELHPLWLGHLIDSDAANVRVVVIDEDICATAIANPQAQRWFIDDVAVTDDSLWPTVAAALVTGIPERPAITCSAAADRPRIDTLEAAGFDHVSSYWIKPTEPGPAPTGPLIRHGDLPEPPPHSFGGPFDPEAAGALAFSTGAGTVIGSPSSPAPPVYDPGGPVTVVDRLFGNDLDELTTTALAAAAARGDVLLAVVCAPEDRQLIEALDKHDFERTVDVHRWPSTTA